MKNEFPKNGVFSRTEEDFLGKIEKEKAERDRKTKPYRNLGICSDTISRNQGLKSVYFINCKMITQTIYILICTGVNTKTNKLPELTTYHMCKLQD